MCGARESESRSPSRTTSWSSTIRVVISSGMRLRSYAESGGKLFIAGGSAGAAARRPAVADAVRARELRTSVAGRLGLGSRQVGAPRVEALVVGEELGPVARQALEEVLARARAEVEEVRPDAAGAGLARGRDDARELLGWSERPGRSGAMPTEARTPASTSTFSARSRCRGGAVPGSVGRQTSSSSVGTENVTETSARRAASTSTSTSRTISGPRVMIENGFAAAREHLEAGAGQPVAALGRLVRVGRRADRDRLALPRAARELRAAAPRRC